MTARVAWKLVPVEPTEAMMDAAIATVEKPCFPQDIYAAMLAASPASPPAEALPSQTSGAEAGGDLVKTDLEAIYEWLREPDFAEQFDIVSWANRRPTSRLVRAQNSVAALAKPSSPAGSDVDAVEVLLSVYDAETDLIPLGHEDATRGASSYNWRKTVTKQLRALRAALSPSTSAAEPVAWHNVLAERRRQVEVEGWTAEHDDDHDTGDLAAAGSCYALSAAVILNPYTQGDGVEEATPPYAWPWEASWWKIDRNDPRRALVKAAALILAEIERLDRNPLQSGQAKAELA